MLILSKTADTIEQVKQEFQDCCPYVGLDMQLIHMNNYIKTYEDYVEWALKTCLEDIPTPFSMQYPNCFGINLGSNYFTLRIPNKFGIGIKVNKRKKVYYEMDVIFYNEEEFIIDNKEVKHMIEDKGWKVKTPGNKAR